MKVSKAIETLTTLTKHDYWSMTPINSDAIKLGIEALKFYQGYGDLTLLEITTLLPGETKE